MGANLRRGGAPGSGCLPAGRRGTSRRPRGRACANDHRPDVRSLGIFPIKAGISNGTPALSSLKEVELSSSVPASLAGFRAGVGDSFEFVNKNKIENCPE